MENFDALDLDLDFDFNNADAPELLNFSLENLADPAFLQDCPSTNLEPSIQQAVEVVKSLENISNENHRNDTEYVGPDLPQQPYLVHKAAGVGNNPAPQQMTNPVANTPFVTTSVFPDPTQINTMESSWNTGGGYPPSYGNTIGGPNVAASDIRSRPLSAMPEAHLKMYRSSRANKVKEDNSAGDVYPQRPPRPQPWGFVDETGQHQFRYTAHGELDPSIVMTHREMSEYLYARPFRKFIGPQPRWEERQLIEGMRSGLTLWIGWHPPHSKSRQPSADTARCRLTNCPVNNRTIAAGEPRVIFDERFNVMGTKCDPYHNAGYCHLYCLEKYFDILKLFSELNVRFDTRHLVFEEQNWAGLHNRHHEQPHIAEAWREREMPKYIAHCASLRRKHVGFGRMSNAQAQRPRCFNDSLTRELVTHSILKETNGVKKARIARRRRAKSANRPVPCDVEIHLGNLDFMQQCNDEKRFDKAVSKSRAERERRMRRNSSSSDTLHSPGAYQPMMFMEGFVPGRSRMTPPPSRRKRQSRGQTDSWTTERQATYGSESASMAVDNSFLYQEANLPPHLAYGVPGYSNTNLGTQAVQANPYSYAQQYIPHPQIYTYPPEQSTIVAHPRPVPVFGITELSSPSQQLCYNETEQVNHNAKRLGVTGSPSPKRTKLVQSNQAENVQTQTLRRKTSTLVDWPNTTSFDMNKWIETVTTVDRGDNKHWWEGAFDYNANYMTETSPGAADWLSNSIVPIATPSLQNVITHQGESSGPQMHTAVSNPAMNSFNKTLPVSASPMDTVLQPNGRIHSPIASTDDHYENLFFDDPIGGIPTAQEPPDKRVNKSIEHKQNHDSSGTLEHQVICEDETYMLVEVGEQKDRFRVRKRKLSPNDQARRPCRSV